MRKSKTPWEYCRLTSAAKGTTELIRILFLTAIIIMLPTVAAADDEPAPAASFPLTVYDFGEIGPGEPISCEFPVKNTGDAPLIIHSVETG